MTSASRVWWKAAWPLLLCAATAAVTLACVRLAGAGGKSAPAGGERITVEHVRLRTSKPFGEVTAAFEARLGKFDPQVYDHLRSAGEPEAIRAKLEAMAGPSGFMLFRTSDHGALLRLVGRPRKAVQYLVGNPLFAVEMTRHAIGAALYAPLRVLIYEAGDGTMCVEYDLPSSLFGQFRDERVDRVAGSLDRKLSDLLAAATR
jgi:uncharacterized protein (DUF302 family)